MTRRLTIVLCALPLAAGYPRGPLAAQGPAPLPQTYSFTLDPALSFGGPAVVTVVRDGTKELVDQVLAPMQGRPTAMHTRTLYDFGAHRIYTVIVSDPSVPCGVSTTPDTEAPMEFDLISGGAQLLSQLIPDPKARPTSTRADVVAGVAAKLMEYSVAPNKARVWVAASGNYPLKIVSIAADGKAQTMVEVKRISFAKPAAATFAVPAGCGAPNGTSTSSNAPIPPAAAPAPAPAPAAPAGNAGGTGVSLALPIRINAGGPAQTDTRGIRWEADKGFSGGKTFQNTNAPVRAPATGGNAPNLFQTERYGESDFSYTFDVPNGKYRVRLRFAEIYFKNAGERVMGVDINDHHVLDHFDIIAEAKGPNIPIDREADVEVTNGHLVIHFIKVTENPKVNAIEISKAQ